MNGYGSGTPAGLDHCLGSASIWNRGGHGSSLQPRGDDALHEISLREDEYDQGWDRRHQRHGHQEMHLRTDIARTSEVRETDRDRLLRFAVEVDQRAKEVVVGG